MDCGAIVAGLTAATCGQIAASGTGTKIVLMNYDDIDKAGSTVAAGVASSIVMKPGKLGFLFETFEKSVTGEATFSKGTYIDTYDHALTLRIFIKNQLTKTFINKLIGSRLVAVVENRGIGTAGEVKYEVYGWDSGMRLTENAFTTDYADNVVYTAKLASDDTSKEGQLPLSYYITNLATTETAFASLYTD